jgi:hypothetical protein
MLASKQQNRDREGAPTNYLITWVCYGAWLPGQCGAVPRTRNRFGAPLPESDARKEEQSRSRMTQDRYLLDPVRRQVVSRSLREVCTCRGWTLFAAHVRTNHVHVVLMANCKPDLVLNTMKSYSSRGLKRGGARQSRSSPLGATRQHPLPLDGRRRSSCDPICCSRAGRVHGGLRSVLCRLRPPLAPKRAPRSRSGFRTPLAPNTAPRSRSGFRTPLAPKRAPRSRSGFRTRIRGMPEEPPASNEIKWPSHSQYACNF